MHMCWLGGHFDEEYTPWEYLRRGAKASLSVIRLPSRLSAARQSDDREGGLRAPAEVLPRRVLLVEVAAQPAHVHAPRAQLHARVSFPDAVRMPDCAD